jgi:hypothetical protein
VGDKASLVIGASSNTSILMAVSNILPQIPKLKVENATDFKIGLLFKKVF